jgi:uncharacterized protein YndB with AHSA1/START domain
MTSTNTTLEVSRWVPTKRDKVFAAWTHAKEMDWYCPEDMKVISAEADVRVGGEYRAAMKDRDGETHTCYGQYVELVPDRRIAFTLRWEEERQMATEVIVDLAEQRGGTRITIRQKGFDDPGVAKGHEAGWMSTLGHLAHHLLTAAYQEDQGREAR